MVKLTNFSTTYSGSKSRLFSIEGNQQRGFSNVGASLTIYQLPRFVSTYMALWLSTSQRESGVPPHAPPNLFTWMIAGKSPSHFLQDIQVTNHLELEVRTWAPVCGVTGLKSAPGPEGQRLKDGRDLPATGGTRAHYLSRSCSSRLVKSSLLFMQSVCLCFSLSNSYTVRR